MSLLGMNRNTTNSKKKITLWDNEKTVSKVNIGKTKYMTT